MPSSSATMSDTVRYTSRSPGPADAGNASAGESCAGRLAASDDEQQCDDGQRERRELQPELERLHERDRAHAARGDDDRDEHGDRDRPGPRGQPGGDPHGERRALQLRHDVEPSDHDHQHARDPPRPLRLEARLGEVGDRVGARAAQRRRDEQQQHQVAARVADREPQGGRAGQQDEPRDPEERCRREVLAADRRGVPPRAHGAARHVEVARRARDAQAVEADEGRHERHPDDRDVADRRVHSSSVSDR